MKGAVRVVTVQAKYLFIKERKGVGGEEGRRYEATCRVLPSTQLSLFSEPALATQ